MHSLIWSDDPNVSEKKVWSGLGGRRWLVLIKVAALAAENRLD